MSKPLLVLHGALGASDQFLPLAARLAPLEVHRLDLSGHGGQPFASRFEIEGFAEEVLRWMDEHGFPVIDIFGYSMGGYIALYLARHHPERVSSVFTLATKLAWNRESAEQQVKMLDPERMLEKVPGFAAQLQSRHTEERWKILVNQTALLLKSLGERPVLTANDFAAIKARVQLAVGDRDQMVSLEETSIAYRALRFGQLLVLPKTTHPIEQIDLERLAGEIHTFVGSSEAGPVEARPAS